MTVNGTNGRHAGDPPRPATAFRARATRGSDVWCGCWKSRGQAEREAVRWAQRNHPPDAIWVEVLTGEIQTFAVLRTIDLDAVPPTNGYAPDDPIA